MRWMDRLSPAGRVLGVLCAVLAVVSAVWLARADERLLAQIPKRQAQGRELRLEHHMALGFHRAAWAGLVVGGLAVATVGWWGRRAPAAEGDGLAGVLPAGWPAAVRRREVMLVAVVAMTVSGVLRWPRLAHSFWSDEAYAARAYVWGVKEPRADGGVDYRPVAWREALFFNERANNQVWCSIEARLAHRWWCAVTGAADDVFSERVMRFPAFVWGLLTVGAVSVLGAMLGGRAGAWAGLLLAVHPWHVRFAAEMRGYSAMLLALVLGLLFLLQALRDGRWRWWLLLAAANLWALLAFAGSAHVPLVCCGAAAGWLVWRRRPDLLARLVLANALAAVAFLWIYGPSITQLQAYLGRGTTAVAYQVSAEWLRQFGESLCLGVPWSVMSREWQAATWLKSGAVAAGAVAVVAALAVIRVGLMARWWARLLVVPFLIGCAGALSILQSLVAGSLLLMWYLLPVLIGWVLLLGSDPEPAGRGRDGWRPRWRAGLAAATMTTCLVVWTGTSVAMVAVPRQPMREAGAFGGAPGSLGAVAGISDNQLKLYDPHTVAVKTAADLERAEARAAAAGKQLWVSVGGWEATREQAPDLIARLTGGSYEMAADLPGWEPMFSYQVWRRK